MTRHIIHVDMDAFFAAVEQRDHPELVGKPVIVGGDPHGRGVVSAASYEAREYGVHSAMPMKQALKRCPQAEVKPVHMERYVQVSRSIHGIFEQFTPLIEPVSIDEAFLDVTSCFSLFGTAVEIASMIKQEIKRQTGLTASVGVAPNKFLAKLASDLEKPDGMVVITEENKQRILDPLPVGRIWGVGRVTERALRSRGIRTIVQLRRARESSLKPLVGSFAAGLLLLARGIDDRPLETLREAKSMSTETTFAEDITDGEILRNVLSGQVDEVGQRLRSAGIKARTITVKFRYGSFKTITRSFTLSSPTNTTMTLWNSTRTIFKAWQEKQRGPLRLIGFAASSLEEEYSQQQLLFEDPEEKRQQQLDRVMDRIQKRFGRNALRRGY